MHIPPPLRRPRLPAIIALLDIWGVRVGAEPAVAPW